MTLCRATYSEDETSSSTHNARRAKKLRKPSQTSENSQSCLLL